MPSTQYCGYFSYKTDVLEMQQNKNLCLYLHEKKKFYHIAVENNIFFVIDFGTNIYAT